MIDKVIDAVGWLVVLFILGPLVIIIGGSFTETPYVAFPPTGFTLRWYQQLMHRGDFLQSFLVSVALGALCCVGAMLLGVTAVIGLHRHGLAGSRLFRAFLMSPLVLPTIVTGVALLQFYYLIDLDAPLHRSANSLIRSLERTSEGGVLATTCSSRLADVRASSSLLASSIGSGRRLPPLLLLW